MDEMRTVMRTIKISEFQTKDVINVMDGRRLGQLGDLEVDLEYGRIEAITVPAAGVFKGWFGGGSELVIPWEHIVKIGTDVILVRLEELAEVQTERRRTPQGDYVERWERKGT